MSDTLNFWTYSSMRLRWVGAIRGGGDHSRFSPGDDYDAKR
jgi:hypothetical protein